MTRIKYGSYCGCYSIHAEGHASGSKEACNGISAILYALKGYLVNAQTETKQNELTDADAHLVFYGGLEAKAVYKMTVCGLLQIAKAFPEFVKAEKL